MLSLMLWEKKADIWFSDAGSVFASSHQDVCFTGEDLKGFKPNMYRLMQRSQTPLKIGLSYNHVFEQERNRVEFITDWPKGNDANIISSLQVSRGGPDQSWQTLATVLRNVISHLYTTGLYPFSTQLKLCLYKLPVHRFAQGMIFKIVQITNYNWLPNGLDTGKGLQ